MKKLIAIVAIAASTSGCSFAPQYVKIEPLDHVSHLLKGPPFGPRTEEDSLTQSNLLLGYHLGKSSYLEGGVGMMWTDSGFYGGPFTATLRFGSKICFKSQDNCNAN